MPTINLRALHTVLGVSPTPVDAKLTARYWAAGMPVTRVQGADVVFSDMISVDIVNGVPSAPLVLAPTGGVCCVKIAVKLGSQELIRYVAIPATDTDFGALTQVDPMTFQPTDQVLTAWQATVAEVTGLRDQAAISATSADGSATTANTAATTATTAAGTATTQAGIAATKAGDASTSAAAAALSTTSAATSATSAANSAAAAANVLLNDAQFVADQISTVGTPAQVKLQSTIDSVIEGSDYLPQTFAGLGGLVWYDDFSRYADGAISGSTPVIGPAGKTWGVFGAQVPVVASGALVSSGVGYAYADLGVVADVLLAEVEWVNPSSNNTLAMAWVNGGSFNLNLLPNHVSIGPRNEYSTIKRGANFPALMPQFPWRSPMVEGRRYLVGLAIVGDQLVVVGNGDVHTSPRDSRVNTLPGNFVFWEPLTVSGSSVNIHRVAAYKFDNSNPMSIYSRFMDMAASGIYRGLNESMLGSPYSQAETRLGDSTDNMPGISFGATEVRARLTSAASAAATTILIDKLVPSGTVITINPGDTTAETVTTTGYPSGSNPYTVTITTGLVNAHSADEMVSAVPPASRRARMLLNQSNGYFFYPNLAVSVMPQKLYFGASLDAFVERPAAGVIYAGPTMRTARGTSGSRPSAATVGQGAQWFDTTLGKPIWSDGTNWRDAAGTVV